MATMTHLLHSSLHRNYNYVHDSRRRFFYQAAVSFQSPQNLPFIPLGTKVSIPRNLFGRFDLSCAGNGGGGSGVGHGSGGDGGGSGWSGGEREESGSSSSWWQLGFGIFGFFTNGWRSRVAADLQFPFKVLTVGVTVCVSLYVLGYMASKALDSFISTLVVESMLHLAVMYLLAPRISPSLSLLLDCIYRSD